jgi:hypothetical protein
MHLKLWAFTFCQMTGALYFPCTHNYKIIVWVKETKKQKRVKFSWALLERADRGR